MRKIKYTDDEFIQAVIDSFSVREVFDKLNLVSAGGNYQSFYNRVNRLCLDISHFTGQGYLKGKIHNWSPKKSLADILIKGTTYRSASLRKRLVNELKIPNECFICKITDWQYKPISLHLDHINGEHTDNRLENLRLLCPNCHSQTETYCVKNRKEYPSTEYFCLKCKKKLSCKRKTGMCVKCCKQ